MREWTMPLVLIVSLMSSVAFAQQGLAEAEQDGPTLYQQLGGYDAIAGVIDEFLKRFTSDPELAPWLGGLNAAAGARVRQRLIDFTCAQAGGPCLYLGADMRAAHEGLNITGAAFDAVIAHFDGAMDHQKVPAAAREGLLAKLRGMKVDIVGK